VGCGSPQFDTSSRRADVVRWNLRNSATWNNNLNFRSCFVFCSRLWAKYFQYFTQKSFTVSRCEWSAGRGVQDMVCRTWSAGHGLQDMVCRTWSAGRGLEAVSKEKRIPAPIGNKIPIVRYLDLLVCWRFFLARWQNCEKRLLAQSCPSVRPHETISAPAGRVFVKFYTWVFFKNLWKKNSSLFIKSDKNKGYFTQNLCTFMTISRWVLPRIRNISDKVAVKIKTHILRSNNFFPNIVHFMR
jgi:hypothetical protein